MPKETHIVVRVEPELRARLQRIAILERRNLSDLARIVFEDYIARQEHALNLTLRDTPNSAQGHQAAAKFLHAAGEHARGAASEPHTGEKITTYRAGRKTKKKPTP